MGVGGEEEIGRMKVIGYEVIGEGGMIGESRVSSFLLFFGRMIKSVLGGFMFVSQSVLKGADLRVERVMGTG